MAGHSNEQTEHIEAITKKNQKEVSASKLWNAIIKNYEMIQGTQLSNSFILLMVLNEAKEPLTTTHISELISKRSKGEIYKISATLRDSLEHRLKREGYVEGIEMNNKGPLETVSANNGVASNTMNNDFLILATIGLAAVIGAHFYHKIHK
ncbi:MAG: hypothetical protein WBE68_13735 [Candidatus Nitrosopolaris sp.]